MLVLLCSVVLAEAEMAVLYYVAHSMNHICTVCRILTLRSDYVAAISFAVLMLF